MPAVLLEGGTIVNRDEEIEVSTPAYRSRVAASVATAMSRFCNAASDTTYAASDTTYRVTGVASRTVMNVRSGPDSNRAIIGSMPPNARGVRIVGTCAGRWCPISYEKATRWVNRRFLARE
jgi:uncharacterized protein YraI